MVRAGNPRGKAVSPDTLYRGANATKLSSLSHTLFGACKGWGAPVAGQRQGRPEKKYTPWVSIQKKGMSFFFPQPPSVFFFFFGCYLLFTGRL